MRFFLSALLFFVLGFGCGVAYRKYCDDWCVEHVFKKMHALGIPPFSWGTVLLAVAVVILGFTYYLDHQRWARFLDCQDVVAQAQHARSGPAAELNKAQTETNVSQGKVNHILATIAHLSATAHQPPTPAERDRGRELLDSLGPAADQASADSDLLAAAQTVYDLAVDAHPLPICGAVPK